MAHDHAHIDLESGDRRVSISIWANGLLTVAQIVGGILSGSLALIADALHNFSGCCHVNSPNLQVGKLFVDQAACAADFHASNASSRW